MLGVMRLIVYLSGASRQTIAEHRIAQFVPGVYLSGASRQTIAGSLYRKRLSKVYLSGASRQTIAVAVAAEVTD